jgi:hypothetical protein
MALTTWRLEPIFVPNFFEPLPFPIVIAKEVDGISLSQPAM